MAQAPEGWFPTTFPPQESTWFHFHSQLYPDCCHRLYSDSEKNPGQYQCPRHSLADLQGSEGSFNHRFFVV